MLGERRRELHQLARPGLSRRQLAVRSARRISAPPSAGDAVITWDNHGRAFFGSESSEDPAGTPKTFGDLGRGLR